MRGLRALPPPLLPALFHGVRGLRSLPPTADPLLHVRLERARVGADHQVDFQALIYILPYELCESCLEIIFVVLQIF